MNMDKVIKIILSILGALLFFLLGWFAHVWKNREMVAKEVKKAISDINGQHKKALESLKDDYEEKLKKKNEIVSELKIIIERLIKYIKTIEAPGVARLEKNLNENYEKLNKL